MPSIELAESSADVLIDTRDRKIADASPNQNGERDDEGARQNQEADRIVQCHVHESTMRPLKCESQD